jgi:hypothetical protein
MNRKEFIRISGRLLMLGLLGITSGTIFYRHQVRSGNGCNIADHCRHCRSLAICTLPEALKYKKNGEKERI